MPDPEDTSFSRLIADLNVPKVKEQTDLKTINQVKDLFGEGITGEKVIGGYKITFKKGLLVGFEPV